MLEDARALPCVTNHNFRAGGTGVLLRVPNAKRRQCLRQDVHFKTSAQTNPHVQVGHLRQPGVVQTDTLINLPPNQRCWVTERISLIKQITQPLVARAVGGVKDGVVFVAGIMEGLALLVDEGGPAKDSGNVSVLLQKRHLAVQFFLYNTARDMT